ncbi:MAG: hypothetical protein EA380_06035 [Phycisphaeraceae bacterium]|nr:MAG: hypothetical protein EA380_06035 [Phycisphaeraceae bacterium]
MSTATDGTIGIAARWVPVERTRSCGLSGKRTNDLYLRLDRPGRLLSLGVGEQSDGIKISGGTFHQNPAGGDAPPSFGEVQANPCVAYDSFLAMGTLESFFFLGATTFTGGPNGNTVLASLGSFNGDPGRQNLIFFGDDGFYIRIGRFTADEGVAVDGEVRAFVIPQGRSEFRSIGVTIPDCPSCWGRSPDDPPPGGGGTDPGSDPGSGNGGGSDPGPSPGPGNGGGGGPGSDPGSGNGGGSDPGPSPGPGDGGGGGPFPGPGSGGGDPEPLPQGIEAVWVTVSVQPCVVRDPETDQFVDGTSTLDAYTVTDLYLRMGVPHRVAGIDTYTSHLEGILLDGNVYQHPQGTNKPTNITVEQGPVCRNYDSFLDLDGVEFGFYFAPEPFRRDWGNEVRTTWFWNFGAGNPIPRARLRPELRNDQAYYFRIMRLTAEPGTLTDGNMEVFIQRADTGTNATVLVPIPNRP